MDAHDLVPIYTCTNPAEAEILRNALHVEGIACEIDGENQAGLAGIMEIRLLVRALDAERARQYLEQHEHHEEPETP